MDAEADKDRGFSCFSKGQYNEAVADFTKALETNPTDTKAYYNRGLAYMIKGHTTGRLPISPGR
jgi:Flp pilus assembly protein TadD